MRLMIRCNFLLSKTSRDWVLKFSYYLFTSVFLSFLSSRRLVRDGFFSLAFVFVLLQHMHVFSFFAKASNY